MTISFPPPILHCLSEAPKLRNVGNGHVSACLLQTVPDAQVLRAPSRWPLCGAGWQVLEYQERAMNEIRTRVLVGRTIA